MKLKVWIGITFASLMIMVAGAQVLSHSHAASDPIDPLVVKYASVDPIGPLMPRSDG
jgi:hypothetical protein